MWRLTWCACMIVSLCLSISPARANSLYNSRNESIRSAQMRWDGERAYADLTPYDGAIEEILRRGREGRDSTWKTSLDAAMQSRQKYIERQRNAAERAQRIRKARTMQERQRQKYVQQMTFVPTPVVKHTWRSSGNRSSNRVSSGNVAFPMPRLRNPVPIYEDPGVRRMNELMYGRPSDLNKSMQTIEKNQEEILRMLRQFIEMRHLMNEL